MTKEITFRFVDKAGKSTEYPGAFHRDYFRDNGYQRAHDHPHPEVARRILAKTYRGPNVDGIGVAWEVTA